MPFERFAATTSMLNKLRHEDWALTKSSDSCEGAMPLTEQDMPEYAPWQGFHAQHNAPEITLLGYEYRLGVVNAVNTLRWTKLLLGVFFLADKCVQVKASMIKRYLSTLSYLALQVQHRKCIKRVDGCGCLDAGKQLCILRSGVTNKTKTSFSNEFFLWLLW